MEWSDESTVSSEQSHEERQSRITFYVGRMVRYVARNPMDSAAQIMEFAINEGPRGNKKSILRLFKGAHVCRETCRRMEVIRRASLENRLRSIPVELRWEPEPDTTPLEPPYQDYSQWWAPQLCGRSLFPNTLPIQLPEIPRYPTWCDADEYFESDLEEEMETSETQEENQNMEVDGENQVRAERRLELLF